RSPDRTEQRGSCHGGPQSVIVPTRLRTGGAPVGAHVGVARPYTGRTLLRRPTRAARGKPGAPAHPRRGRDGSPPVTAGARQRARAAPVLSRDRRGDQRGRRDHAGRGVVRRQLPHRRRGPARGPRGPPAWLLPP